MDQAELLGAGATLLFLGVVAGMCVWCPRLGTRRSKQIFYEQRDEGRQSFTVARAFSIAGMAPEETEYSTVQCPDTRKDKLLYSLAGAEDPDTSRYQNFRKGSRRESEAAYVDPIASYYYNCGQFQGQPQDDDDDDDDDDDTISYENVLICKPVKEEDKGGEESPDYQNSASIEQWRLSVRVADTREVEPGSCPTRSCTPTGSPEEDPSEPDYVNGDMALQ